MPKPLFLPLVLAVAAAVLAVHAACISRPTTYADGAPIRRAPVRVAPAFTPPGTGLPEYWGPPEAKPDVQPQPKPKRYLPPEPDGKPGIWASEAPPAPVPTRILNAPTPFPPDISGAAEAKPAILCIQQMDLWARTTMTRAEIEALTSAERTCLAARLYNRCAEKVVEVDMATWVPAWTTDPVWTSGADKLLKFSVPHAGTACSDPEIRQALVKFHADRIVGNWWRHLVAGAGGRK